MASYILTFRVRTGRTLSKAEEAAWPQWFGQIGDRIIDAGGRVGAACTTDRIEHQHRLGGYVVVTADSLDDAVALAAGCPIHTQHGHVEIGELVPA